MSTMTSRTLRQYVKAKEEEKNVVVGEEASGSGEKATSNLSCMDRVLEELSCVGNPPPRGREGMAMEVMGLMLGEFDDEYTVRVIDDFTMPQSGTEVSVEAVDHVFQMNMFDMLKQTGS